MTDANGRSARDEVLKATALCLKRSLRAGDTVARLGGDEFAALPAEADAHAAEVESCRVQQVLRQTPGRRVQITYSIGVLTRLCPPSSVDELIETVDNIMCQAKEGGNDAIRQATYDGSG